MLPNQNLHAAREIPKWKRNICTTQNHAILLVLATATAQSGLLQTRRHIQKPYGVVAPLRRKRGRGWVLPSATSWRSL